ncbi:hypothetical protein OPT61_g612 [Boeremia exigua]|uniref:Uncharacterized protein n=1 Tax=Boeremia exigua TaxID=749465 RepID=A0ACC2ITP6_9PLEO|nr:hypothetical protein OPT61_g612 [Boeremia exigua]
MHVYVCSDPPPSRFSTPAECSSNVDYEIRQHWALDTPGTNESKMAVQVDGNLSTILLSQVGVEPLPVAGTVAQTYYGFNTTGRAYLQDSSIISFLHSTPIEYPAFAEWTSNAPSRSDLTWQREFIPNNSPGIRDTGTVMRALLPVKDATERSRITDYQGIGTVLDTRVVCVRPKLVRVIFSTGEGYRLIGQVDVDVEPRGFMREVETNQSSNLAASFDCSFSAVATTTRVESWTWPLAICSGKYLAYEQGIYSVLSTAGQEEIGKSYIIVNATLADAVTTLDESDVWVSTTLSANDSSTHVVTVQITLCMTAFDALELELHATRRIPILPEPRISWDISKGAYDTKAVLQQLGADRSPEERGLFKLEPRSWEWVNRTKSYLGSSGRYATTDALYKVRDNVYNTMVNKAQYAVFSRMARSTGNPALALQAYFTTLCAIAYRDRMNTFDIAAPSTLVTLVQATRPLGWTGFIIVIGAVCFHLVLVVLAAVLFYRAGKLASMGNAWAAVSQLLGPATDPWIRDANTVDDRTVNKWLKSCGKNDTWVQLEEMDGRALVVGKDKSQ